MWSSNYVLNCNFSESESDAIKARAFNLRGHSRHAQGREDKAEEDYLEALRLDPDMALAKFNLSVARGEEPDGDVVEEVGKAEPMNERFAKEFEKFKK